MTRYLEVTHRYIIPVPAEDMDAIEPIADEGISIMEGKMKGWAGNLFELRSNWIILPREYVPAGGEITFQRPITKQELINLAQGSTTKDLREPGQISFTEDILGQQVSMPHPWDQGLRVLPLDHPLAGAELRAMEEEGVRCDFSDNPALHQCILVKGHPGEHVLEITPGVHQIEQ